MHSGFPEGVSSFMVPGSSYEGFFYRLLDPQRTQSYNKSSEIKKRIGDNGLDIFHPMIIIVQSKNDEMAVSRNYLHALWNAAERTLKPYKTQ